MATIRIGSSNGGSSGYTWEKGKIWRNQFVRNTFLNELLLLQHKQGQQEQQAPAARTVGSSGVGGNIRDVALGGDHTIILMNNQKDVYVFGKGGDGQLGLMNPNNPFVSAPTKSKRLSISISQQTREPLEQKHQPQQQLEKQKLIAAVCAIKNCSITLDRNGEILNKVGKCSTSSSLRNIEQSLQFCKQRAKLDGLLASKKR